MLGDFIFDYKFTYKSKFENGLIEHETDYIFVGKVLSPPQGVWPRAF